jgi:hypothetical protein
VISFSSFCSATTKQRRNVQNDESKQGTKGLVPLEVNGRELNQVAQPSLGRDKLGDNSAHQRQRARHFQSQASLG